MTDPSAASDRLPSMDEVRRAIDEMKAASYASPSKDCDMVMKGGITSGVVYPLTIAEVAKTYRLHSIGGASAGAIAACVAAAAEHRRQVAGDDGGFRDLAGLPQELGGCLETLFQPTPGLERPFAVLLAALDPKPGGKIGRILRAVVRQRVVWFAAGAVLALLAGLYGLVVMGRLPIAGDDRLRFLVAAIPTLLGAVAAGLLAAGVGLGLLVIRRLPANGYGLCDGLSNTRPGTPLTTWLTLLINRVAGLPADPAALDDESFVPLTVGDLCSPRGSIPTPGRRSTTSPTRRTSRSSCLPG